MKFCSKCGKELVEGICKNCAGNGKKNKTVMIVGAVIAFLALGYIGFTKYEEKKINEKRVNGIELIGAGEYKEAHNQLGDYIEKRSDDKEIVKIYKDLTKGIEVEKLIEEKDFDGAKKEIGNLNYKSESEYGKNISDELKEKVEVKYREEVRRVEGVVGEKKEFLDGCWLTDAGIWQFKKNEGKQMIHNLHPQGLWLGDGFEKVEYDEAKDIIKILNSGTGYEHEIGDLVQIKIVDNDNIELQINKKSRNIKAKRISEKEAVAYMYGYALTSGLKLDAFVFGIENFEGLVEEDETYTEEKAIEFLAEESGSNKENFEAKEIEIIPGYKSYEVHYKGDGGKTFIFEENLKMYDFLAKYKDYAKENNIEV